MKTPKKSHQRYTTSFKLAAVRLAEHKDIQTQDVAVALDIHPFMLSRWKKEYRDGVLKGVAEKDTKVMEEKVIEQSKIRKLEKRMKKLEQENELLKKSISWASKRDKIPTNS